MTKREKIAFIFLILVIAGLAIFFGSRKYGYHIDEVWNFGLANNIGSIAPNIEYGKEYYKMGPYEEFVEVKKGEGFNYLNVWNNQTNDVHPPLYYIFVHTICSLFPNTFNKWYGIAVNLFWMVFVLFFLFKLSKDITKDSVTSLGIILAYGMSVGFFDTVIFIRMYMQFTFFAVATAYLIKLYWDRELDRKFYILYSLMAVLGMLTHYYYLIFLFFLSGMYAIHLFLEKRYKDIKFCIITAACDGMVYILIWHQIVGHLFRGYRGKQALKAAVTPGGLLNNALQLFEIISGEGFAYLLIIFVMITVFILAKRYLKKELRFNYENALLCVGFFYFLAVAKLAPFIDFRYTMPIMFIIFMTAFMNSVEFLGMFMKKKVANYVMICVFILSSIASLSYLHFYVPMDHYSEKSEQISKALESEDCLVYIEDEWESLYYFEKLQHAKSYTFVSVDDYDEIFKNKNKLIITQCEYADKIFDGVDVETVYTHSSSGYYRVK